MAYIGARRGSYKKGLKVIKVKKHSGYQLKIRMHRKLLKKVKKTLYKFRYFRYYRQAVRETG